MPLPLNELGGTFILDLDGVLVKHNGHLTPAGDQLLPGIKEFFSQLTPKDQVIIASARESRFAQATEKFLKDQGIIYKAIIYELPTGPRVLINDGKPGVPEKNLPPCHTTFHLEVKRDEGLTGAYEQIEKLSLSE